MSVVEQTISVSADGDSDGGEIARANMGRLRHIQPSKLRVGR